MLEVIFFILILAILIGGFFALAKLLQKQDGDGKKDDQSLLMLQNQINELQRALDSKLSDSSRAFQASSEAMRSHLGQSLQLIQQIGEKLGRVDEGQKQVLGMTDQLQQLQNILKNPKQRGILGEYFLETTLKNVLPPNGYKMQYGFPNGTIVDAAVFVDDKVIPIDSKFSLENYNRMIAAKSEDERRQFETSLYGDLKRRVDETAKYIDSGEGACDVALMYIPSEGVFYDLIVNSVGAASSRSLIEYANEKKVTIVSPTLFYVFLQTILQTLKQREFNKSAQQIQKNVGELARHLGAYDTYMRKLGTNMAASVKMYNSAYQEFRKIDKDVIRIGGEAMDIEPKVLEGPLQSEE